MRPWEPVHHALHKSPAARERTHRWFVLTAGWRVARAGTLPPHFIPGILLVRAQAEAETRASSELAAPAAGRASVGERRADAARGVGADALLVDVDLDQQVAERLGLREEGGLLSAGSRLSFFIFEHGVGLEAGGSTEISWPTRVASSS